MMIVKSKNTGLPHTITRAEWDAMRKRGDNRHYQIVDDSDDTITQTEIKIEDISIVEFEKVGEAIDVIMKEEDEAPEDEAEFYRKELREAGVEFRWNTGLEKLKQKYEEI